MVYLIHFEQKIGHAQHYIGFVNKNLNKRIKKHENGSGSKLLRAVNLVGIKYKVVRTWKLGDRNFERKLKNWKKTRQLCPICSPNNKCMIMEPQEIENNLNKLPVQITIEGSLSACEVSINDKILPLKKSLRVINHSPDGFNWGYGGSGPAQFALALLLEYLPKDVAIQWHQSLKFGFIAGLPRVDFIKTVNLREVMRDILKRKEA